jgi:hypothetical protein
MNEALEQLKENLNHQEGQVRQADHNRSELVEKFGYWSTRKENAKKAIRELEAAIKLLETVK